MIYYLWVFILAGISLVALGLFLYSLSKDIRLGKKLKKKKTVFIPNFLLLIISLGGVSLIFMLFLELKRQLDIFS